MARAPRPENHMLDASRELLSKLPVAIVIMAEPAIIRWANPRALELLGLPLDQLTDRLANDVVHPEDRKQAAERAGEIISGRPAPPIRYRVVRPNGTQVEFDAESVSAEIDGERLIITVLREPCPPAPSR